MLISPLHGLLLTGSDLLLAFVLGAMSGLERQWRQRTAGLRTNTFVAVGAAIFVDLALRMGGCAADAVPSAGNGGRATKSGQVAFSLV